MLYGLGDSVTYVCYDVRVIDLNTYLQFKNFVFMFVQRATYVSPFPEIAVIVE